MIDNAGKPQPTQAEIAFRMQLAAWKRAEAQAKKAAAKQRRDSRRALLKRKRRRKAAR